MFVYHKMIFFLLYYCSSRVMKMLPEVMSCAGVFECLMGG